MYLFEKQICKLMSYLIPYSPMIDRNSDFADFLGIHYKLDLIDIVDKLIAWSNETGNLLIVVLFNCHNHYVSLAGICL